MKIEIIDGKSTYIIDVIDVMPDGSFVFNKEEYNKTNCTHIKIPSSVATIGEGVFKGCTGLAHIVIPNSVRDIGIGAFQDCTGLTHIEIPNSVATIRSGAFQDCTSLTHIEIPSSVTTIGYGAFEGCTGLTHIEIPSGVRIIGNWAFAGCTGLTHIEIPSSVTTIDSYAFAGCTGLAHIEIPSSVRTIEERVFQGCTGLTHIVIPSSVTTIGIGVFQGCTGLTHIEIPSGWTTIGIGAFEGCAGLTHIEIPSSVTTIGYEAFESCTGLTHIEIPSSVTTIWYGAFQGCTGLTHIEIPSSVRDIKLNAFKDNSNLNLIKINTDNKEEFKRIKGLLPGVLKDAARMATFSDKILKKRAEALVEFYYRTPSISLLFGHKALYDDVLGDISSFHISSKLPLVKEAKKKIARLPIPANERELENDYDSNLKVTVKEFSEQAKVIQKLTQYLSSLSKIVGKNTSANFFSQSSKPSKNADIWSTYNVIEKIINYLLADKSKTLSLTEEEENLIKTKDSLLNLLPGDIQEKIGLNQSEVTIALRHTLTVFFAKNL